MLGVTSYNIVMFSVHERFLSTSSLCGVSPKLMLRFCFWVNLASTSSLRGVSPNLTMLCFLG